jgi:hypothetical protein
MTPRRLRDRPRRAARRDAYLEPKRRILAVCEGKVTEPEYLRAFSRWCRNPRVELDLEAPAGVPLTLVARARERKEEAEALARHERDVNSVYDEVWCVFDMDEHPHVNQARRLAAEAGLRLAMSNPCFELWLLLHLREHPGARHRQEIQQLLAELMPRMSPKHIDFESLVDGYEEAVRRAERLEADAQAAAEHGRNPSTEMFHLTNSIDEAGCAKRQVTLQAKQQHSLRKAQAAAQAAIAQAEREAEDLERDDDES